MSCDTVIVGGRVISRPKSAGKIVGVTVYKENLIVACEGAVLRYDEGTGKLVPIEIEE